VPNHVLLAPVAKGIAHGLESADFDLDSWGPSYPPLWIVCKGFLQPVGLGSSSLSGWIFSTSSVCSHLLSYQKSGFFLWNPPSILTLTLTVFRIDPSFLLVFSRLLSCRVVRFADPKAPPRVDDLCGRESSVPLPRIYSCWCFET